MSSNWRSVGRALLFPTVEHAWGVGFAVAGSLIQIRPGPIKARWASNGGGRILIAAAHPDDETIGCAGVIARHRQAGDEVTIVIVTDGGASQAAVPPQRAAEVALAAERLGGAWQFLNLPEGAWTLEEAKSRLREILDGCKPDIVYAPSCVDYHPEHVRVASVLAETMAELRLEPRIRVYELGVPLTPALANLLADILPVSDVKVCALAAYPSQKHSLEPIRRLHRYNRRLYGGQGEVEVFWEMTAPAYIRLMVAGDWTRGGTPFRGVRGRPFGDLLPYMVGLRERRRLRDSVSEL